MTSDDSTLYYLTGHKGLMKLDIQKKQYEFLLEEFDRKLVALNSVAVDEANQVLYISDCGTIPHVFAGKSVLLSNTMGRILKFDLRTRTASVLVDKVSFPNGIVYEKSTHSIIFSEFSRNRIWKYDLSTGSSRFLLENLSGYADNLKLSDTGDLLVAIILTRDPLLELIKDKPALRKYLMYVPDKLIRAVTAKRAGGLRVDPQTGEIKEYIFGAPTKLNSVSTINERNGKLYFSSLFYPTILVLDRSSQGGQEGLKVGEEL